MNNWLKEKRQDFLFKIILFWIFPVISFFYSFVRANTRSSYFVFSGMAVLFGMAFSLPSGKGPDGKGYDGQVYRAIFDRYQSVPYTEFLHNLTKFLSFDSYHKDFYIDTLAFLVSRVTDNYHLFFMTSAAIFSYFCLKSFRFLTREPSFRFSLSICMLILLFMLNPLFNINGMRFWTTSWIAVYCIFQIYINKNNKYYFLALITPFFHGSFYIFIIVLLIAKFFKRYERAWFFLFVLSFAFSNLSLVLLELFSNSLHNYLPTGLTRLLDTYTDQEYISETATDGGFIRSIFEFLIPLYLGVIILIFKSNSSRIKNNPKTKDLYLFLLVWLTIFNFLTFIPSLGGRYLYISYPIIAYIWLVNIQSTKYNIVILLTPVVFLFNIYMQLLYHFRVLDPSFFYTNPFFIIYKYLS